VTRPSLSIGRFRHPDFATAVRFLFVGAVSTVVTIGLFNLLVHIGSSPLLANHPVTAYILAMLAGLAVNYAGNRFWAFGNSSDVNRRREVAGFLVTNAVAIAIPSLCLAFSRYVLRRDSVLADNISANAVGLVLATLARWIAYRYVVFGKKDSASRRGAE
jgi:putative flippase GtrA